MVEIKNVTKRYENTLAVNNLSLKIADKYIETLDFMFLSHNYKKRS